MKLNARTLALIAICVVVIGAVLVINNQQASQPDATPTPTQSAAGPLFPNLDANTLARIAVTDNNTGRAAVYTRAADGWTLADDDPALLPIDGSILATRASTFAALRYEDTFTSSDLAPFGLDTPDYTITATAEDGTQYTLHVGGLNPSGTRYYVVNAIAAGEPLPIATAETTPEAEMTPEATDASKREAGVAQDATEEAEATEAATETGEPDATGTPAPETTPEATRVPAVSTPEAAATEAATAEVTPEVTLEPLVTLAGEQRISTVTEATILTFISLLNTPPRVTPTPAPTATPTVTAAAPDATLEATAEATDEADASEAATPEATDEADS